MDRSIGQVCVKGKRWVNAIKSECPVTNAVRPTHEWLIAMNKHSVHSLVCTGISPKYSIWRTELLGCTRDDTVNSKLWPATSLDCIYTAQTPGCEISEQWGSRGEVSRLSPFTVAPQISTHLLTSEDHIRAHLAIPRLFTLEPLTSRESVAGCRATER